MPRRIEVEAVLDTSQLERGFKRASQSANRFERNVERGGRGAAVAALRFRGLGRAVAFASSSFLGGYGLAYALTSTVKAAEESQRVLGQTRVAVERAGLSWRVYRQHIEEVSKATSQLSGFDDERLLGTFNTLVRRTGDVNQALRLNALAANVARGRNIELEQASQLVLKASIGNVGALRRLGINIDKNATAYQALDLLQRKYAGSAAAYGRTAAGAQDRFRVSVENLQEAIGKQLLPVISRYLNMASTWLNKSKNQKQVTDDFAAALRGVAVSARLAAAGVKAYADAVSHVPGGKSGFLQSLLKPFGAIEFFYNRFKKHFAAPTPANAFRHGYGANLFAPVYGPPAPTRPRHGPGYLPPGPLISPIPPSISGAADTPGLREARRRLGLPGRVSGVVPSSIPGRVSGAYQFLRPSFDFSARLQLQQARAEALGQSLRPVLLAMRRAAYRALHSGRLAIEAQTDAWNAIAQLNGQLKQGAQNAARAQRRQALRYGRAAGAEYQFAYARGGPTIHIEHFYSAASSPRALENELARRARARAHVRRGAR